MYIDNSHVSADVRTVNERWKQLGLVLFSAGEYRSR